VGRPLHWIVRRGIGTKMQRSSALVNALKLRNLGAISAC
jgi:hypothetical protein